MHRVFVKAMAGMADAGFVTKGTMYLLINNVVLLIFLIVGCTNFPAKASSWLCSKNEICASLLQTLFVVAVFVISVAYLVNGTYNPFLYFRF